MIVCSISFTSISSSLLISYLIELRITFSILRYYCLDFFGEKVYNFDPNLEVVQVVHPFKKEDIFLGSFILV